MENSFFTKLPYQIIDIKAFCITKRVIFLFPNNKSISPLNVFIAQQYDYKLNKKMAMIKNDGKTHAQIQRRQMKLKFTRKNKTK